MKEKEIRVLKVSPHENPTEYILNNTLEAMQEAVRGCIEIIGLDYHTCILLNDEGKLIGLEGNRRIGDDIDLSGREIVRFSYKNTEQPVTSWIDMMEQTLKILHAEDKSVLSRLAYSKDTLNGLNAYVSNKPEDLRNALEIDMDIFIERNTSTSTKISMLHRFLKCTERMRKILYFILKI